MESEAHRGLNPPAYFLAALLTVVSVALGVPFGEFSSPLSLVAGMSLLVTGIGLNLRGVAQFDRVGTPIRPGSRAGALVTTGVYRFSRNPMYLGMASMLLGTALSLGSPAALLVAPVFMWILGRRFIAREESILEEEFGRAYRDYRGRVRRWL